MKDELRKSMYRKTEPTTIQTLFGTIAPYYDKANAVLSLGFHKRWNRALVKALSKNTPSSLLDLCAGTGEIAFDFLKYNPTSSAILLDFCPEMLEVAAKKGTRFKERFSLVVGDAQHVPLSNTCVDAVSVAYGIRNVQNPESCFKEVYRVLNPGGMFAILELTRPNNFLLRAGHAVYLKTLLPILGKWVAKDQNAYHYLSQSIQSFVSPHELAKSLSLTGFSSVALQPLMLGIATLILARK